MQDAKLCRYCEIYFVYYISRNTFRTSFIAISMTSPDSQWTLLSNHGHVLVCLAEDSHMRLKDVAVRVGITERAVQRIIAELEEARFLSREREGRRNHYRIHGEQPLRHPLEQLHTVGELIEAVSGFSLPQ